MAIAKEIYNTMNSKGAGVIRAMFEAGIELKKQFGEDNVYDFSLGNPDLEPPKEVRDAIHELANNTNSGQHAYMSNAGYMEARSAMAKKVSIEQGLTGNYELKAEHTVLTVGAAGALNAVLKAILNPNDIVLVSVPFFPEYAHYCKNHGGKLLPVEAKNDLSLHIENFEQALQTNDVAAVLLNSPNNPSGKIYTKENIESLILVLKKHGEKTGRYPYIICDEPYREITFGGKTVPAIFPLYEHTIVVSSFAKNLSLPGERIGYIAVNPSCPDVQTLIAGCTFTNRTLGYVNAPAFFQKVVSKSWNAKVDYSLYEKRCTMIANIAKEAGIEFAEPEGAFYLFCKVPNPKTNKNMHSDSDDFAFCDHLKTYNILVAPGTGFGCKGWFRIAYCVSEKTIESSKSAFLNAMKEW